MYFFRKHFGYLVIMMLLTSCNFYAKNMLQQRAGPDTKESFYNKGYGEHARFYVSGNVQSIKNRLTARQDDAVSAAYMTEIINVSMQHDNVDNRQLMTDNINLYHAFESHVAQVNAGNIKYTKSTTSSRQFFDINEEELIIPAGNIRVMTYLKSIQKVAMNSVDRKVFEMYFANKQKKNNTTANKANRKSYYEDSYFSMNDSVNWHEFYRIKYQKKLDIINIEATESEVLFDDLVNRLASDNSNIFNNIDKSEHVIALIKKVV